MVKNPCSQVIALNYFWHPKILGEVKQKQIILVTSEINYRILFQTPKSVMKTKGAIYIAGYTVC